MLHEAQSRRLRHVAVGFVFGMAGAALVMAVNGDVLRAGLAASIFGYAAAMVARALE